MNNKKYIDADQKYVKCFTLYFDMNITRTTPPPTPATQMHLYYDEECTKPITDYMELHSMFETGLVVKVLNVTYDEPRSKKYFKISTISHVMYPDWCKGPSEDKIHFDYENGIIYIATQDFDNGLDA